MSETKKLALSAKGKNLLVKAGTTAAMIGLAVLFNPVFAGMEGGEQMKSLLTTILPYLAVIGVPIALMGGFKLIMAFRNDQGDAVPAAARDLAIGIIITAFATIGGAVIDAVM